MGASFAKFKTRPRRTVRLSQQELIKTGSLGPDQERFPLLIEPNVDDVNLSSWAAAHRDFVEQKLLQHGVILFRGFEVAEVDHFQNFVRALDPDMLEYKERAAPRHEVAANVYTSTEFPADQTIPMHHEMSYSHNWPTKLFFYCDQPPQEGGRTPVTDDRKIVDLIDPEIKERFLDKKVMYVRNYGEGVDLSWREAFQTDDRSQVEDYCRRCGMEAQWRDGDRLRTQAVRQVLATHPKTGDTVWFNHAHMFHSSNLQPAVREALLSEFAPDELPRNAFYGDGTEIEDSVADHIRDLYEEQAVRFSWQHGDIMLVDNFLASHGREPFVGPRKILVAMAELYTNPDL